MAVARKKLVVKSKEEQIYGVGNEHTMEYTGAVLQNCTLEADILVKQCRPNIVN